MKQETVRIRDISFQGWGVGALSDGRIAFIPDTWIDDLVEVSIEKDEKRYVHARVVNWLELSHERSEGVICDSSQVLDPTVSQTIPYRKNRGCGGCAWIGINYHAQLRAKEQIVKQTLMRGKLQSHAQIFKPIIPSPQVFNYRGRAQVKTNSREVGFFSAESRDIVDVPRCHVMNTRLQGIYSRLLENKDNIKPEPPQSWTFVDIDDKMTDLEMFRPGIRRAFFQANDGVNSLMKDWVRRVIALEPSSGQILELFCGNGNFTEVLAEFAALIAVENDDLCLDVLSEKKLTSVTVKKLDLFQRDEVVRFVEGLRGAVATLFLDPPRPGCAYLREIVTGLGRGLEKIIYVSCNVQSFNRDAIWLQKLDFELESVQPIDQFPHTPHIEILGVFRKSSGGES